MFRLSCHLTYTWLLPWGDDEGRMIGDPIWILANVIPYEDLSIKDIEEVLTELHRVELIRWYEVDGEKFIEVVAWREHQKIRADRLRKSNYPEWMSICGQMSADCGQMTAKCGLSPSPSLSPTPTGQPPTSGGKVSKKDKPEKVKYLDCVYLTEDEHAKLLNKHGPSMTTKILETLNNYKQAKGKRYASDYHAILNWVEKRVEEDHGKANIQSGKPPGIPWDVWNEMQRSGITGSTNT